MARNQRSTSKNTRSGGAAGRGASSRGASGRGGATGRGGSAGRGSKKAADWGGYFGSKNGKVAALHKAYAQFRVLADSEELALDVLATRSLQLI